jgi:hypothetical protein
MKGMVLSKRERLILVATIAVLMIFALDRFLLTPALDARGEIINQKRDLIREMEKASELFKQKSAVSPKWEEMINGGMNADVSSTESIVLNALRTWAQNYGLTLSSIKPEREKGQGGIMQEILFNVACSGNMSSVGQFLWQIENTTLPLRITEFQLGSREEDGKEMSLQMKLSALYLAEGVKKDLSDIQPSEGEE